MVSFGPEVRKSFPLPVWPHRLGENERPKEDLRSPVSSSLDLQLSSMNWASHDAYLYGFFLYRWGYYWEAHEIWEPVWMQCPPNSIERLLLQAIIQIANAALKESQHKTKAATRLQSIALELLREVIVRRNGACVSDSFLGVELEELEGQLQRVV